MSLIKQLAGETAIYGISSVLTRILHYLLLTPYLTRIFDGPDQDQYGIHGIMYAFGALLMVIFTYRMETAFFRFGSKEGMLARSFSTASTALLVTSIILVGILIYFSEPIAAILTRPGDQRFVIWFVLIIGLDALAALPFAKLRLENRPIRFATIKVINILITAVIILFFLSGAPYLSKIGFSWIDNIYDETRKLDYVFLANLAASAMVLLFLFPEYRKIKFQFDFVLFKKMILYAGPLIIVGVAGVINQLSDRFLLKELLPGTPEENLVQVGIYSGCIKIAVLMSLFIQAFNYAAEPFFFRNADRRNAKEIYAQTGQAFAIVGSVVFLSIMLFLDLVKLLIDEDYWMGLTIVAPVLLAYLFLGLYYNFSIWYKLKDKTSIGGYIALGGSIISLTLNIYLIPRIGFMGAAYAVLACYLLMAVISYLIGRHYYPIPYPIFRIAIYIGSAVFAYAFSAFLQSYFELNLWPSIGINTVILLIYGVGIYLFERKNIRRMLLQ